MSSAHLGGYALVALSAVLLACHWQRRRDLAASPAAGSNREAQLQLRRRSVASALIGVVGAAMTLDQRVPLTPLAMTAYLLDLVLGAVVILAIAVADWRAVVRQREREQLDRLAQELKRAGVVEPKPPKP